MPLIQCQDLVYGFNGTPVTPPLNFSVNEGDFLCIVGKNGAGKSTLVRTLLGKHPVMGGTVFVEREPDQSGIGYLPQQTPVQRDFPASVKEVVLSGCIARTGLRPFFNRTERQMALDCMKKFGIENLQKRCYRELSGGQQQRVLLARAFCATRRILLLDEPTAGLDSTMTERFYELLKSVNEKDGVAIVMVTHDISAAKSMGSHILKIGEKPLFLSRENFKELNLD